MTQRQALDKAANPAKRIPASELHALLQTIFVRADMAEEDAAQVADVLVWAELQGRGTHGAVRAPWYVELIQKGDLNPHARPKVLRDLPAILLIDAQKAAGPVALRFGLGLAVERAKINGGCFTLIRKSTHVGALGYYVRQAAEAGMAAIAFTAGKPLMALHGAAVPSASTSPIAFGAPSATKGPLVFDMATSVAALGRLKQLASQDAAIPDDWALDSQGCPTNRAADAAIPLPVGGAKGSGLALMFEVMTGVLGSWPIMVPALSGSADIQRGQNTLLMVMDPAAFGDPSTFGQNVDAILDAVHDLPPRAGFDRVNVPGDRSAAEERARRNAGIPVPVALLSLLQRLAGIS